jgi:ribosome-binding protein aMBF1 (putative translation factor)
LRGYKTNLNTLLKGRSDSIEHGEGMTLVISVFETTNHGSGGSDQLSQLTLRQPFSDSNRRYLTSDVIIGPRLFQSREACWISRVIASMNNCDGIRCRLPFCFSHNDYLLKVCRSKNEGVAVMKAKRMRIALKDVLERELKDPEFSFYYQREKAISEIAQLVRDARLRAGLTQAQLAEKAQSSQVVIARLESGTDDRVPSLDLLERIASALKARLLVRFEYKKVA